MIRFAIIISLCLLRAQFNAFAQTATLEIEKHTAQIGEPINLQIKLKINKNDILFSDGRFALEPPLELLRDIEIDSANEGDSKEYVITAKATSFDEGDVRIGPFYFGQSGHIGTNAITVTFTAPAVDTAGGFRDIKPPLAPSRGFWDNLPYALFILITLLVAFYFYRRLTKKSRAEAPAPQAIVPPYDLALLRLRALKETDRTEPKRFFSDLSFILKDYFSDVWKTNALEATTEDLLDLARKYKLPEKAVTNLKYTLQLSDLVKFAKLKPNGEVTDKAVQTSIEFVESTREFSVGFNIKGTKNDV